MITIAIIGLGHWGPNYVRNFDANNDVNIKYVCDLDQDKINNITSKFKYITGTTDLKTILNDNEVQAVIVTTPATQHFDIIKECLSSKKNVLAEKPLTLLASESKQLVELSDKNNVILMVGHTFLFNPGINKIKEIIDQDIVGSIYYLNATRTHLGLIREDVNAIWDLAPHDISIFNYITNSTPKAVSAFGGCFLMEDREDVGFINLQYPKNIIANIHVSWADSNKERSIRIVGSKARVVFNDLDNLERVKIYKKGIAKNIHNSTDDYGSFQLVLRDGEIVSPRIELKEPLKEQCNHFITSVKENKKPLTDGQNGYEVVKVMEAIHTSIKSGGKVIEIS